jgi:hypothetical protein
MRIVPLRGLRTAIWSAAALALTAVSAFSQVPSSTVGTPKSFVKAVGARRLCDGLRSGQSEDCHVRRV